ncbi:MAG: hypothetical protein WAO19_13110 [Candidatus Kryptoniota bacterium]
MRKSKVLILTALAMLNLNWKSNDPTIEINRNENNGRMNVIPCIIKLEKLDGTKGKTIEPLGYFVLGLDGKREKRIDKKGRIFLIGGDRGFLKVKEGEYRIGVYTPSEYQEGYVSNNTETWRSNHLDLKISGTKRYILSVEPTADGNEYNGGWTIHLKRK